MPKRVFLAKDRGKTRIYRKTAFIFHQRQTPGGAALGVGEHHSKKRDFQQKYTRFPTGGQLRADLGKKTPKHRRGWTWALINPES